MYTRGERFCPLDAGAISAEDRHSDARVGRTIDERYFVRRLLGRGGMGSVYEADHVGLDKRVAIKFLSTNLTDRESLARFRREAKVAGKIDHQHVVRIFDVGSADADTDFIVMELIDGKDLAAVLRDDGPLDPARTISIIRKVLRGLRAIHTAGIVHRDIKPANVLVSSRGAGDEQEDADFVKIMDFGISKSMNNSDGLTNTGAIIGTPEFMAPEQLLGDAIDQRTDLYAVGLMAFRMLTGKMPFTNENTFDRASAANPYVEVPRIGTLRPDVPTALSDALAKALAKEPEHRYPDAQTFLAALEGLGPSIASTPVRKSPPPSPITGTEQTVHAVAAADTAIAPVTGRTVSARRAVASAPADTNASSPAAATPTLTEQTRPRSNTVMWAALGAIGIAAAAVVIVMVTRGGSRAEPPIPPPQPATSTAAGSPHSGASSSNKDKAAAHLQKAREFEAAGKLDAQLQELLAAYAVDPDSGTTFQIAELHERLEHTHEAITYFQRYLHMNMHATDKDVVQARIKKLEDWLAAELKNLHKNSASGSSTRPVTKHAAPKSNKTCMCIAVGRDRRNSMSLCPRAEATKCRCEASGVKLCTVDVNPDGSCPDAKYDKFLTPAKADEKCQGFVVGGAQGQALEGIWECSACTVNAIVYHGENGDPCVGYYRDNGRRAEKSQLIDCH